MGRSSRSPGRAGASGGRLVRSGTPPRRAAARWEPSGGCGRRGRAPFGVAAGEARLGAAPRSATPWPGFPGTSVRPSAAPCRDLDGTSVRPSAVPWAGCAGRPCRRGGTTTEGLSGPWSRTGWRPGRCSRGVSRGGGCRRRSGAIERRRGGCSDGGWAPRAPGSPRPATGGTVPDGLGGPGLRTGPDRRGFARRSSGTSGSATATRLRHLCRFRTRISALGTRRASHASP